MSRVITIVKAKLDKKGNLIVSYNEKLADGNQRKVNDEENTTPVHPDLLQALKALDPHLARLCEQYDDKGKITEEVECRSFSLKGEDDSSGITLSGVRKVANNKSFAINSPFLHWGREDNYAGMQELIKAIERCEEEVTKYIVDGKHADDNQLKMFDAQGNPMAEDFIPGGFKPIEGEASSLPFLTDKSAAQMITTAGLTSESVVLIPCANDGVLIKTALTTDDNIIVDYTELLPKNNKLLTGIERANKVGNEVMQLEYGERYDRIVVAPPRSKGQEIDIILKLYNSLLKPGGRLVACVSLATMTDKKKSTKHFVEWLKEVNSINTPLGENAGFRKDGTGEKCLMVVIDKA